MYVSGTNAEVNKVNNARLSKLEGKEESITASVYSETKSDLKPNIDKKKKRYSWNNFKICVVLKERLWMCMCMIV